MGKKRRDGRAAKRGNSASSEGVARNSHGGGLQQTTGTGIRYLGGIYEGEMRDGKPHGRGVYSADGGTYEGEIKHGKHHGRGVCRYADGGVYDGEWKDDNRHGWGTFTWTDGKVYEGQWVEGIKHGKGTFRWADGRVYEGEWDNDDPHGKGTMTWPSGEVYEGQWVDGKYHGNGTRKLPTGEIFEGVWMKGELVRRKLRSQRSQRRRLEVAKKTCEHCGVDDYQFKLRACSGCNLALYCSAACQKAARGSHQRICDISSQLPSRDAGRLVLEFEKGKRNDFDAGLRYATKYMDNMKHLSIDVEKMGKISLDIQRVAKVETIRLSASKLRSLLKSKKGVLESFFLLSDAWHDEVHSIFDEDDVLKELHGLKQLRLGHVDYCDDVQLLRDIIGQQKDTLEVLFLAWVDIDWRRAKCRRAFAQAVGACKHLVKLELEGCVLTDSDLKIMLQDLPNLRILNLTRYLH